MTVIVERKKPLITNFKKKHTSMFCYNAIVQKFGSIQYGAFIDHNIEFETFD